MPASITLDELLAWCDEAAAAWRAHFDSNPSQLELPCDIGGAATVQALVRHVWGVELLWAQRIAGLPVTDRAGMPAGPLDALYTLHAKGVAILREVLGNAGFDWEEVVSLDIPRLGPGPHAFTRRKLAAHALVHSQRHYAQLATLLRQAGHPAAVRGDLLLSSALS